MYLSTRRDHNDYIDFWSKKKVKNYIIFFWIFIIYNIVTKFVPFVIYQRSKITSIIFLLYNYDKNFYSIFL